VAFQAGRQAQVFLGGNDISGYLTSVELGIEVDTAETTTLSSSPGKTYITTLYGATISASGVWDTAQDGINAGILTTDGAVITYCPAGGRAVGDRAWLMAGAQTSYSPSSEVGDAVQFSWEALSEVPVVAGNVLHPLGEDTNTTTGSSRDDSAATSTGWTANLHVTLVDGGSWVVKLEDSANNSDWSDVSGGAFTAATGVTAQRLASAAGATLRRYVRYTATRTGGSAGQGITFALSYARLTSHN
jgi:hypothetical protein